MSLCSVLISNFEFLRWALLAALLFAVLWVAGFPTARAALEQKSDPNTLTGIGAVLILQDGGPMVREIVPNGPAGRDGRLQVGDSIAGVAQGDGPFVTCAAMTLDKVVDMIRGGKGTTVRLQVISGGKLKIINLVRAQIKLNEAAANAALAGNDETPAQAAADAAKLADLLKNISEETRKLQTESIATKVDAVAQATGLDATGRKALEKAAAQAVDQGVQKSDADLAALCSTQSPVAKPAQLTAALNSVNEPAALRSPAGYAKTWQRQAGISPSDMPAWEAGLKQTLTPAQAAMWDAAEAKRKLEVESESGEYLGRVDMMGMELEARALEPAAAEVRQALNLSSDRLDKLNALEKSVAQDFGDSARAAAEKALLELSDDDRRQVIGQKAYYNWLPPLTKNKWNEAVAKSFSPDEVRQIQTAKEDRKGERARAMGRLLLALMDERTALTAAQRQLLEPIAERLVKSEGDLVSPSPNVNYSISVSTIYEAAGNGSGDEIKAILDPIQWQHWQDAAQLKNFADDGEIQESVVQLPASDAQGTPPPPAAPAPEDVERAISDFLAEKSKPARELIFDGNMLKAEDAARVLHLPEAVAERLETAARGEADAALREWNTGIDQMVRSNISDATPETVKQRLAGIQSYQFGSRRIQIGSSGTPESSVWAQAIKDELSPDQQKAWKVETDARQIYSAKAEAGWITCAFAQNFGLSPDQTAKLEPMVGNVLIKYSSGIGNFFSNVWYLESFYMYLPVAGIPEKDLQAVLSKDEMDHWKGSQMHAIATTYFAQIARMNPQQVGF
jgi:hypothetical protein